MLVECLTGRYPFDASGGPMELIIHVSLTDKPDHHLPGANTFLLRVWTCSVLWLPSSSRSRGRSLSQTTQRPTPCLLPCIIMQVLQDDVTLPPPGTISELCRDFLTLCLQRDPARRPPATALLTHPWVAQAAATDVKGLMKKTMFLAEDRCAHT